MHKIKFVVSDASALSAETLVAIETASQVEFASHDEAEAAAWEIPGAGEDGFEAEVVEV